jgi:hypothetical protein
MVMTRRSSIKRRGDDMREKGREGLEIRNNKE